MTHNQTSRFSQKKLRPWLISAGIFTALSGLIGIAFQNCSGSPSGNFAAVTSGSTTTSPSSSSDTQDTTILPGTLNPYVTPGTATLNLNYSGTNTVTLIQAPAPQRIYQRDSTNHASFPVEGRVLTTINAKQMAVQAVRIDTGNVFVVVAQSIYNLDANSHFLGTFTIPTGGNYILTFAALDPNDNVVAKNTSVWPLGAGEVFLTAGGSNSSDCCGQSVQYTTANDPHFQGGIVKITGPTDAGSLSWSWTIDNNGGSPWPAFAMQLSSVLSAKEGGLEVPVAIVDLGCAGTSSSDWMPNAVNLPIVGAFSQTTHQYAITTHSCGADADGTSRTAGGLYNRIIKAAALVGNFRGILWNLGESDVSNIVNTQNLVNYPYPQVSGDYYNHMQIVLNSIKTKLPSINPSSFIATATYFPSAEVDANCQTTGSNGTNLNYMLSVQSDQGQLVANGFALAGPDVDSLWGTISGSSPPMAYRYPGSAGQCEHFSNAGLPLLGKAWEAAVFASGLFTD